MKQQIADRKQYDRFKTAKTALIMSRETSLFGAGSLRLELVEDYSIPTACTNGVWIKYNPDYLAPMSDAEVLGLMAHEVGHCQLGHPWRLGDRDPELANIAMDYALDSLLIRCGLKVPDALVDPRFDGKSFEAIYAILADERQQQRDKAKEQGQKPEGTDASPFSPKGKPQPDAGGQPPPGDGGEGDEDADDGQPGGQGKPAKATKGEVVAAPADKAGEDLEAEWRAATLVAAALAEKAGRLPGYLKESIEAFVRPPVDWRGLTQQWASKLSANDYTWSRPSRRHIGRGFYLPSLSVPKLGKLVVVFDTSGSISGSVERAYFGGLSEVLEDLQPESIEFLQVDTDVRSHQSLVPGDAIVPDIVGRGGTDFRPAFQWVEDNDIEPAGMIFFTDTYGDFPDEPPPYPVLWACSIRNPVVPFGDAIEVEV